MRMKIVGKGKNGKKEKQGGGERREGSKTKQNTNSTWKLFARICNVRSLARAWMSFAAFLA